MNKFLLLLILVLSSCTSKNVANMKLDNSFKEKMSFKEFDSPWTVSKSFLNEVASSFQKGLPKTFSNRFSLKILKKFSQSFPSNFSKTGKVR